jgi:hypothetical protein
MPLENADKDKDKDDTAKAPPAPVDDEVGKEGTQAERMLDRIIARYGATPEGIAKGVYDLSFGEREKVMLVVATRFGNGFTNEVERAIGLMNQERAAGGGGDDKDQQLQALAEKQKQQQQGGGGEGGGDAVTR